MISWVTGNFSEHIYSYILYLCTIQSVHKAVLADLILSQHFALRYPCGAVGSFRINILTCYSAAMLEYVGWLKTTYSSQKQTGNYHPWIISSYKHQDQHVYTCLHLKLLTTSTVADHHPKIRLFSRNHAIEHDPGRSQYNQDQHIQHEG